MEISFTPLNLKTSFLKSVGLGLGVISILSYTGPLESLSHLEEKDSIYVKSGK